MKVIIKKNIQDNVNIAVILVTELTQDEKLRFSIFGEPFIDLGGTIQADNYPSNIKKIYSESPYIFKLDVSVPIETNQTRCQNWITEVLARMSAVMTDLNAKVITWIDETEQSIP